jgi:cytochrome c nitrite reductase small subunit
MRSATTTIAAGILVGLVLGLALYTFVYARGYSYLTNNPEACANCHVMQDYYSAWMKSSHHAVAKCNDCHTPHNLAGKYAIKATNGFFHSLAFTTGRFPDNIRIKGYNQRVTESTCKACHAELTASILGVHRGSDISCISCHFNVGHTAAPFSFASVSSTSAREPATAGAVSSEANHAKRQ